MFAHDTAEPGIKKIEGHCGVYYFSSSDEANNPDRKHGIRDHVAVDIVEAFEERCGGSAENVGREIVEMKKFGGIKHDGHFFHVKRRSGSNVALEIVTAH